MESLLRNMAIDFKEANTMYLVVLFNNIMRIISLRYHSRPVPAPWCNIPTKPHSSRDLTLASPHPPQYTYEVQHHYISGPTVSINSSSLQVPTCSRASARFYLLCVLILHRVRSLEEPIFKVGGWKHWGT